MSFDSLGLSAALLRAINARGYTTPTPIQAQAIPPVLAGRDVMAAAQTGTGKTAGFTLPMLDRLMQSTHKQQQRKVRALVLTPTRELCAQVMDSVRVYGKHLPLQAVAIFGGVSINPQKTALRRGADIVVATPGRLLDHINQGTLRLKDLEILVLDEADRMLDMGFIRDIRKIIKLLPEQRQNLMFSATFSDEIRELAGGILKNPANVEVAPRNTTAELIAQKVHPVQQARKRELLSSLITHHNWQQVLVFTRTKHGADRLCKQLGQDGLRCAAIHGNKTQSARTRALEDFKRNKVQVLVATDIAARGLDIAQLPHVVNYELPHVAEDYVHRIGRTGRAGRDGEAVSLVCREESKQLAAIERLLNRSLDKVEIEGFEGEFLQGGKTREKSGGHNKKQASRHFHGKRHKQPHKGRSSGKRSRSANA